MGTRVGAITFGGLSSGLPTDEIIQQLLELQRRPIDLLERQKNDFNARLTALQDLNTKTLALRDTLRRLDNMANVVRQAGTDPLPSAFEEFRKFGASSSDETIATASVGPGATAGSLTFEVNQLALQHRERSDTGFSSADDVFTAGGGTLSIQIGSTTPASTDISIAAGTTLQGAVDAINATADLDVTAFVVNDGKGAADSFRIFVVSDQTGVEQTLDITTDFGQAFTATQTAQNARITLDPGTTPTEIDSASNKFESIVQGITISALSTTGPGETATVTVNTSTEAVSEAMSELVAAYNDIAEAINVQNQVDPTTNRGGPLIGDSTMVSLDQRLSSAIARSFGSGEITTLGQIGLELTREGLLELDETALSAALESDFESVAEFFSGVDSFSDELREVADSFVDPVNGSLIARINGTTQAIADVDESISAAEDRLDTIEENLLRQFAALERTLSEFQQQGNFLASFLLAGQSR